MGERKASPVPRERGLLIAKRETLPDRVYAILKHRILTCDLLPGKKLNEKNLADQLRVSRTPLREALNRLAREGLVDLVQFKGYVVTPITPEDIHHLSELRRIVESQAAALAALRATEDECEHLRSLARLNYTPGDRDTYEAYLQANTQFHCALAHTTRNPRLEHVIISVLDHIAGRCTSVWTSGLTRFPPATNTWRCSRLSAPARKRERTN